MEALKTYAKQNFEQVFILLILTSVVVINYLIPFKLVFLNLYFIVILLGFFFWSCARQFWEVCCAPCWSSFTSITFPAFSCQLLRRLICG